MISEKKINDFLDQQRSIHLYDKVRQSFHDVLKKMSNEEFDKITKNLYILCLHASCKKCKFTGATGQAMFFPNPKSKFKIVQITYVKEMRKKSLDYVIAHELGHIKIGYIIPKKNETWDDLELKADENAKKWGFSRPKNF